eukprot:TRINITY_DN38283_c0_g1_i1.p1 TRINITY_DN38283_c0_g1~~TRINITY_DN38283_c0_g1_i1.p1  ORF type:complete len:340 (+),score=65.69 TRINITY_DN38283_c0_g1_i1:24-1022(+)
MGHRPPRRVARLLLVLALGLAARAPSYGRGFCSGGACLRPETRLDSHRGLAATDCELYEVLGVDSEASVTEIKKAYYRRARDCHPDKFPGDEKMRETFQQVADAYATLADPLRRQQYDLRGLAGLAFFSANATRLFGPPPWRVLLGRTDHWLWTEEKSDYMVGLLASAIPDGISGVTMRTIQAAHAEAFTTRVAVLLDRVSEAQAKDTVEQLEEFGLAVKAEPIEGERTNEQESPVQHFRRIQRDLGEASESLRRSALELRPENAASGQDDEEFEKWVNVIRSLRGELRSAAAELQESEARQQGAPSSSQVAESEEAQGVSDSPDIQSVLIS